MDYFKHIQKCIEEQLGEGITEFILYPFGERGFLTKRILNECYGIQEEAVIDNRLSCYNKDVRDITFLQNVDWGGKKKVLITSDNLDIYQEIRDEIRRYVDEKYIVDMFQHVRKRVGRDESVIHTVKGKYSYGPLCNHELVERVGAFCSFAPGTDVVYNHPINLISTHTFLYWGGENDIYDKGKYENYMYNKNKEEESWYFSGIRPKGNVHKGKKTIIGNDVWLGRNVIITNGAHIGNGVIAGAGAVITKDVPDYAIVVGVPAKIIRYRYSQDQIEKLNAIAWWNWSDEKIRQCYNDFFDDVETFISRHYY